MMCILWLLVLIFNVLGFVASRQMANLGYVLWISAMAMSFLTFCVLGDSIRSHFSIKTPQLIHALNSTQLPGQNTIKLFAYN